MRTCSELPHRQLEQAYFQRGKGISKLRQRLKNAGVSTGLAWGGEVDGRIQLESETAEPDLDVVVEVDVLADEGIAPLALPDNEAECDGKAEAGNRRLKAFFGRRRTHNEQLIMRSCGVIIARATFFGSEAISAVNVSQLFVFNLLQSIIFVRSLQRPYFQPPNPLLNFLYLTTTAN